MNQVGAYSNLEIHPVMPFHVITGNNNSFVVDAIYKEYHPEYCQYLYLLIPVSVAFLNPIGFLLLEFQKSTNESNANGKLKIVWKASKRVITNPLVFMVVLGLVFNFALNGTKQYTGFNSSHWFLSPFLSVIGNSFGSTALFYLGLNLVGSMKDYSGFTLVVPFLLVSCKRFVQLVNSLTQLTKDPIPLIAGLIFTSPMS